MTTQLQGSGQVIFHRSGSPYLSFGAEGTQECLCILSVIHQEHPHKGRDGQSDLYVLHKSPVGHQVSLPLHRSAQTLELVHPSQCAHVSRIATRDTERDCQQYVGTFLMTTNVN